jgi:hypothetical protein
MPFSSEWRETNQPYQVLQNLCRVSEIHDMNQTFYRVLDLADTLNSKFKT